MTRPTHPTVTPLPLSRRAVLDTVALGHERHNVHGLIEVDVTDARRHLDGRKDATGARLSFTAFVIASFARAVAAEPRVQAYRDWRNRLVVFPDVDVLSLVERDRGGVKMPVPHVIRRANERSVEDIHDEIRGVQRAATDRFSELAGGEWVAETFLRLPGPLRRTVMRTGMRFPGTWRRFAGTAAVSAVGMFGAGRPGWGVPLATHAVTLTVGSVADKPWAVDGRPEVREILHLTLTLDHDVVDGAPAARFARRLAELLETGACLD